MANRKRNRRRMPSMMRIDIPDMNTWTKRIREKKTLMANLTYVGMDGFLKSPGPKAPRAFIGTILVRTKGTKYFVFHK